MMTSEGPLRVAMVGCGAISEHLHLPAMQLTDRVKPIAAVDIDYSRAQAVAARRNIPRFASSLAEISDAIDAAVIAVPPHLRLTLATEALARGLHVLCEKPLANTVAECEELVARAAAAGRLLGVVHQLRFWPARRWVQVSLRSGKLSLPKRVEVTQGAPYSWQSVTGYTVRREFVTGGVLLNAGTHPLDTLIAWFGDPRQVEYWDDAIGGLESNVRMRLRFERDIDVFFRQSRTCRLSNEIRLIYEGHQLVLHNGEPFRVEKRVPSGASPEVFVAPRPAAGHLAPASGVYCNFAAAIAGRERLEVDGEEGTRVIRLIEHCYQQKRRRPLATLPLPGLTW